VSAACYPSRTATCAAQVRLQMEALLTEKAKLASENARLLRENTGLQVDALPCWPACLLLSCFCVGVAHFF
jgi:hypothetical protein